MALSIEETVSNRISPEIVKTINRIDIVLIIYYTHLSAVNKLFPIKFIRFQINIKVLTAIKALLIPLLIFTLGAGGGYFYFVKTSPNIKQENSSKDPYVAFLSEIYDKVMENYWDNITDDQLSNIYKLAAEKITGQPQQLKTKQKQTIQNSTNSTPQVPGSTTLGLSLNLQGSSIGDLKLLNQENGKTSSKKDALLEMLTDVLKNMDDKQKKDFTVNEAAAVLANLNPFGRSGLYTQKLEQQLKNNVQNINPEKDLYKDLGIAKGSSEQQVKQAYEKKAEELKKESSPEAQQKLKEVAYAKEVLTQPDRKERYDQKGVEPTIFTKIVQPGILYLQFKKFSPTSYDEFTKAFDPYKDDSSLYGLVFDLRGNIGGSIDAAPYFIGDFIGKNQYAFDFFHKGEYQPFKTPTEKLASITKYKQVVILVDNQTQSSAEIMAASFKKYHIGVVAGVPSKGWGTVERVFPLDHQIDKGEKYSIFLVHSITIRDDNQPIEGRGVEPDINIKQDGWEQQLLKYFSNPQLVSAIKEIL